MAERGLGVEDVSVVGYDDITLAAHPLVSLTTVDQFGERMGQVAIELLTSRVQERRTTAEHVELGPELRRKVRHATGARLRPGRPQALVSCQPAVD